MCHALDSKDERQKENNCIQYTIVANFVLCRKCCGFSRVLLDFLYA
jgi:hypothetical protein